MKIRPLQLQILFTMVLASSCEPIADDPQKKKAIQEIPTWAERVDSYWGPAPEQEQRVEVFEEVWQGLADDYACFETFDINWDDTHSSYLPRVEQATSYGRFAQVLTYMSKDLMDPHTYISSNKVCRTDMTKERAPVDRTGITSVSRILGACVTATEDDQLIVYRVDADINPLGLQIGDEIVGYDQHTWAQNLDAIDGAELPWCGGTAATQDALTYLKRASVLMNPQLFSTLQVRRQDSQEIESIDLLDLYDNVLSQQEISQVLCTGQMAMQGIPFPQQTVPEISSQEAVTWGLLPGTNIGYIYVYRWMPNDSALFHQAVNELFDTDALIIDQRFNLGGQYTLVEYGMPLLFNETTPAVDYYVRDDTVDDYNALKLWFSTSVVARTSSYYDKPIALLIGPDAMSGGDLFPYVMAKHPRVRLFGKPTRGGFGSIKVVFNSDSIISDMSLIATDSVMVEPTTGQRLEGYINAPDTTVWLTKDDIIAGQDTVVNAALNWIDEQP